MGKGDLTWADFFCFFFFPNLFRKRRNMVPAVAPPNLPVLPMVPVTPYRSILFVEADTEEELKGILSKDYNHYDYVMLRSGQLIQNRHNDDPPVIPRPTPPKSKYRSIDDT
jgi:hypothetical protein